MGTHLLATRVAIAQYYEQTGRNLDEILVDSEVFVKILAETGYVVGDASSIFIDGVRVYCR